MEEVSEIYHQPRNGRQLQKLRVTSSENSEKFHFYSTKNLAQFRKPKLSCNLKESQPFKCHSADLKVTFHESDLGDLRAILSLGLGVFRPTVKPTIALFLIIRINNL